jgi:hypothetical protein
MNNYRQFFFMLLGLTAINSLGIAALNSFVDPYNVVGSPALTKINDPKPNSSKDTRRFKAINISRIRPKAIFLGTSRTDIGLDPNHPALAPHQPAYNLAIPAGDMYEAMRYFQYALANQPELEQVVIGLDLVAFEDYAHLGQYSPEQEQRWATTRYVEHLPSLLFSTDTFSSSIHTVLYNLRSIPANEHYLENGKLIRHNPSHLSTLEIFESHLKTAYFNNWYKDYRTAPKQLEAFRTIVDTCRERGIDLKVFISPAHVTQWEAIRAANLWTAFEDWKREIVKITPVWDFSGYNSITSEPLSEQMQNYLESSHYVEAIGDLVLNRLFNHQAEVVPQDFGVWLTPDTVEPHLAKIRAERAAWAKQNADTAELVQQWSRE